jgi:hypothetical protein
MPITMKIPNTIYGGGEDPFTCPEDGARTNTVETDGRIYLERCPACNKIFAFDAFYDDEEDEE